MRFESMPGIFQLSVDEVVKDAKAAAAAACPRCCCSPRPLTRTPEPRAATDPKGLAAQAIAAVKEACPSCWCGRMCACAAPPDHGHCGHVLAHGAIDNDSSLQPSPKWR